MDTRDLLSMIQGLCLRIEALEASQQKTEQVNKSTDECLARIVRRISDVEESINLMIDKVNEMVANQNTSFLNFKSDIAAVNQNAFSSHLELGGRLLQVETEVKQLASSLSRFIELSTQAELNRQAKEQNNGN